MQNKFGSSRFMGVVRLCSSPPKPVFNTVRLVPTVSPDKPIGKLWAASSSVIEAQSLTNSGKSSRIFWKIC